GPVRIGLLFLAALALVVAARGLVRRTTWYLAGDQFAFLTFADDLAHGTIFHDPTKVKLLSGTPTGPRIPTDPLHRTYIWNQGRLYSRYPPGFPLLLALAHAVGGETAQHALNPILYLFLPIVLAVVARVLAADLRDGFALGAAVATMWALLV